MLSTKIRISYLLSHQSGDRYKDFGNASSSALTMTGYIKGILEACTKLGIAVRGLYGENSEASETCIRYPTRLLWDLPRKR